MSCLHLMSRYNSRWFTSVYAFVICKNYVISSSNSFHMLMQVEPVFSNLCHHVIYRIVSSFTVLTRKWDKEIKIQKGKRRGRKGLKDEYRNKLFPRWISGWSAIKNNGLWRPCHKAVLVFIIVAWWAMPSLFEVIGIFFSIIFIWDHSTNSKLRENLIQWIYSKQEY
jgi:hypothetical protein